MTINLSNRIGPFCGVSMAFSRHIDGIIVTVFLYGAYDAMGLIGSESNGIGAVAEREKSIGGAVLIDEHMKIGSGWYGASPDQLKEYKRISELSDSGLLEFIRHNRRFRTDNGMV